MDYSFIDSIDSKLAEEIGELYKEAGWWNEAPSKPNEVIELVAGSYCFALAFCDSSVVGMGRAISDGVSDAYVQDITVLPEFRGQGVAGAIVEMIVRRLKDNGIDWIGLVAERGTHKLYEELGFDMIPDSKALLLKG